jgi:hypothetical protein
MSDARVKKYPDEQTASYGTRPTGGTGAAVALCLGMTKLLTNKQVMSAVDLGCCVAIGTADYVIGHAFPGKLTVQPPADLRTCPGPDGLVHVEALTEDGVTFLSLVGVS